MERQKQPSSVTFYCLVVSVEMVGRARWGWVRKWAALSRAASLWVCSVEYLSQEMLRKVHDQIGLGNSASHVFFWRFTAHSWILGALKHPRVKSQKSLISWTLLSWKLLQLNWPGATIFLGEVVQFSSGARSCLTLCDPIDFSTPGFPLHHQLPELAQTHVHRVGDAIQLSHLCRPLLLLPSVFSSI